MGDVFTAMTEEVEAPFTSEDSTKSLSMTVDSGASDHYIDGMLSRDKDDETNCRYHIRTRDITTSGLHRLRGTVTSLICCEVTGSNG